MDAAVTVRCVCLMVALASTGCNVLTGANLNDNVSISHNLLGRAQAPDPTPPVTASSPDVIQAAANIPLKKNEARVRVVAAIGTDTVITDDEVWHMVRTRFNEYANLQGAERSAKEAELFRTELKSLIYRELMISEFFAKVKKNKPSALDEIKELARKEADRRVKTLRANYKLKDDSVYQQFLNELGLTDAGLRRQNERTFMADELVLYPLLRDKIKAIGLADLRDYYDQHTDEFRVTDRAKWLQLTVLTQRFKTPTEARQYADWLVAQARKGEDFVGLVKKYGMGDSMLREGEGIGQKPGEITPKELEPAVFALRTAGEISDPIPTTVGYHIIKVVERDVAGLRPFDEKVQLECRTKLVAQMEKKEREKMGDDLWRKYRPQVFDVP